MYVRTHAKKKGSPSNQFYFHMCACVNPEHCV